MSDYIKIPSELLEIFMAPGVGIEPTTKGLHIVFQFPERVDYIIILTDARRFESFRILLLADSL